MSETLPRAAGLSRPGLSLRDIGGATSAVEWRSDALTAARAWRALCLVYAAEAAGRQADHVKMIINGSLIQDAARWPTAEGDMKGPDAWLTRLAGVAADDDVFVYARGVQRHDRALFRSLVEMLAPVAGRIGLPRGHVEAEVFYGAYRGTPGGIHREGCVNTHLVLAGRKSMHFWVGNDWIPPGHRIRDDVEPEALTPEEYLPGVDHRSVMPDGHFVTATPGSGFFWRSGIWHVGETHEPSMALNVAAYTNTLDPDTGLLAPWQPRLRGEVPSSWLAGYRAHTSFDGDDAALLARLTALGMCPATTRPAIRPAIARPAASRPVANGAGRVRRMSSAPVVWHRDGGDMVLATLGHAARFPASSSAGAWLEAAAGDEPARAVGVPASCQEMARWLCEQEAFTGAEDE